MRMSQLLAPTLRETPGEAEIVSHQLMLRAGLLRKTAAGMYTYLPLGWRVLQKIMNIVREEMDNKGGQELLMPIVQPAELWRETGRWTEYGDEMFRLKDRHGREFCLGPTHEELITALVRAEVRSYRQLPLLLYQIANKYRDEIRPRFGVMRGREFIMKDLYSFDRDEAGLDESYAKMYDAYTRAFQRMGLDVRAVEADPGAIGGNVTHEFMVLAEAGEAAVVHCPQCAYAANTEKAECVPPPPGDEPDKPVPAAERVATPSVRTIDELTRFLGVPADRLLKTLIYEADGEPVAAVVRGDHELNEVKLKRALGATSVAMASAAVIERVTGAPVGFAGPAGLSGVRIVADPWAARVRDGVAGANAADEHLIHVEPGRDWQADVIADIRTAAPGDPCPRCGAPLAAARGIEVGQIFKLGTKYSEVLGATYLDERGESHPVVMGCYGIGISRTMAAIIEQHHDENGIRWPVSVAPYHVVIVPVKYEDERQRQAAEQLYRELSAAGVETVLDDRPERAGVKFKDADLIGFPLRITVGPRALAEGSVELKSRDGSYDERVALPETAGAAKAWLEAAIPRP
ncbi:MAG: proline--tRNA ligase [Firmicutes bacterium]|nr:proline--tRNA ligase [Bacillota bacterium]